MIEQLRILDVPDPPIPTRNTVPPKTNPCVHVFGPGPEGATCKTCVHLWAKEYSRTYYKCELRGDSGGPGTDHRVNWPACDRYVGRVNAHA